MRGARRATSYLIGRPWIVIGVALAAVFAWWVYGTRTTDHEIRGAFSNAVSLRGGLDVRVDGIDAGKITSVKYEDGRAVVGIGVNDEVWPLHRGTRAVIRWGTTAGNGTRYIELVPGPKDAPEIPEDGIIQTEETVTPVEFDEVFNTFGKDTREQLQSMLRNTGDTLDGRDKALGEGLENTPEALEATSGVFRELVEDEFALRRLVANTSRTTRTIAARDAQLRDLVAGAADTFEAFGRNASDFRTDIERFPGTLRESRTTLARLSGSIDELNPLVEDLAPGAKALRPLAERAGPALRQLRTTVPSVLGAVNAIRTGGPTITRMLERGVPFSNDLRPVLEDFTPVIACLRPYAPEIAGMLSNWASFAKNYDDTAHYARVRAVAGSDSAMPMDVKSDLYQKLSGLTYAFPRPPGFGTGTPIFDESCGYTKDALDPSKDPEDNR